MTLDPQAQTVLDLAEKSDRPLLESLDPPAARIQYAEMVEASSGDAPAGVETRELSIPLQDGQIPARLYRPEDHDRALPILVYFHGGGFVIGDRETLGQGYRLTADLMAWFMDHYFSDGGDRDQVIASPLRATDFSGLPPALVLVAGYDPLVDEGMAYAQALAGAGVATDVMEYRGMIHGFITMGGLVDAAADAMLGCGAALREAFASV